MVVTVNRNGESFTFDIQQNIAQQLRQQGYEFMDSFDGRLCQQRLKSLTLLTGCFPILKTETAILREKDQMERIANEIIKKALYWAKPKER